MTEDFSSQIALAGVSASVIEWMKNNKFIPLGKDTDTLNRIVSGGFALMTAMGMSFAFNPHTGSFVLSGNVHDITAILWKAFQSFVYQTMAYHGFVKKNSVTEVNPPLLPEKKP